MTEFRELIARVKDIEQRVALCEQHGGHSYRVAGFSEIVHPWYQGIPYPTSLDEIVYSSYVCAHCGNRVSVEEGRAYMAERSTRHAP
jgi:hypothetical protein